jgi:predicted enzyme related to lactoylglutathione lyase
MKPRLAGFELYFDDLEGARRFYGETLGMPLTDELPGHHARFAEGPVFLCLERKGAENYPSGDKAVVFLEVPDLDATVARLAARVLHFERAPSGRVAWAVLHDPEDHNVLLLPAAGA